MIACFLALTISVEHSKIANDDDLGGQMNYMDYMFRLKNFTIPSGKKWKVVGPHVVASNATKLVADVTDMHGSKTKVINPLVISEKSLKSVEEYTKFLQSATTPKIETLYSCPNEVCAVQVFGIMAPVNYHTKKELYKELNVHYTIDHVWQPVITTDPKFSANIKMIYEQKMDRESMSASITSLMPSVLAISPEYITLSYECDNDEFILFKNADIKEVINSTIYGNYFYLQGTQNSIKNPSKMSYKSICTVTVDRKNRTASEDSEFFFKPGKTYYINPGSYDENEASANEKVDDPKTQVGSNGLSAGAIAGIVIACVVVVAIIGVLIWFFVFRGSKDSKEESTTNAEA